jgi:hypothetical protein
MTPDPERIQRGSPGKIKVTNTWLVALVNNHISRSEVGIQMLLSPFENFIDASMVEHNTVIQW